MTHPQGGHPGHPEPAPVPTPEPEPPQPIPPDDPIPPEPPHALPPQAWQWPPAPGSSSAVAAGEPVAAGLPAPVEAPAAGTPLSATPLGALADDAPTATMPAVASSPAVEAAPFAAAPHEPASPLVAERTQVIPATTPWHAQHEAPGQWQTQPPDHMGWSATPAEPQPEPIWAGPQQPWEVPPPPAKGRRGGLWVSLALAATLLLCAGGATSAYMLLRDADNPGSPDPATAVDRFLNAVYTEQDAAAADDLVCREARDRTKLADRVDEIRAYSASYQDPVYRWDEPAVSSSGDDRAQVSVQITMSTGDERTAEQSLDFTVIRKTGWLVCEVSG